MNIKIILIITDNLPDQINGVSTTYANIERIAVESGYQVSHINPLMFRSFSCPGYHEVKISIPLGIGKRIESANADYIHIATEGPVGIAAMLCLNRKKLSYTTAYHTKFPEGLKKLFHIPEWITWQFVRWFHRDSACVLTTTSSMVRDLKLHGFSQKVVPWTRGVDRSVFNPVNRITPKVRTLVCVSRISKEKNLEVFLDLDYPGAKKIMVGSGPMLEVYRKQYPNVVFTGAKRGYALAEYFKNADVFVFPSRWETFGIVMIEAMACGTPVAAFPCQGPLDVIESNVTGVMNEDIYISIDSALRLDRNLVYEGSKTWSWNAAWEIFRDRLVPK